MRVAERSHGPRAEASSQRRADELRGAYSKHLPRHCCNTTLSRSLVATQPVVKAIQVGPVQPHGRVHFDASRAGQEGACWRPRLLDAKRRRWASVAGSAMLARAARFAGGPTSWSARGLAIQTGRDACLETEVQKSIRIWKSAWTHIVKGRSTLRRLPQRG